MNRAIPVNRNDPLIGDEYYCPTNLGDKPR